MSLEHLKQKYKVLLSVMKKNKLIVLSFLVLFSCNKYIYVAPDKLFTTNDIKNKYIYVIVPDSLRFNSDFFEIDTLTTSSLDAVATYLKQTDFDELQIQILSNNMNEYDFYSYVVMNGTIKNYFISKGIKKEKIITRMNRSKDKKDGFFIRLLIRD